MIHKYTDCLFKFVIIQGRTSNSYLVDSKTCSSFEECTYKLCEMANNSNVDWTCLLLESSKNDTIIHYNNYLFYLLIGIIILLFLLLCVVLVVYFMNKRKLTTIEGMYYTKINNIQHTKYEDL